MDDFYSKLFDFRVGAMPFPYGNFQNLLYGCTDMQRRDAMRCVIEVMRDNFDTAIGLAGYEPLLFDKDALNIAMGDIAIDCIHRANGVYPCNDTKTVDLILSRLGWLAYDSYTPEARRALYDIDTVTFDELER